MAHSSMQNSKHQAQGTKHIATSAIRFLLGIAVSLLLCFGLQSVCYYEFDFKARKSESNYFSTFGRFQVASRPAAVIAFAGSSITGRLPGREVGNDRIANLGSDGGPALDGIRLINMGRIASPQWLVVETNTLFGSMNAQDNLILKGAQGKWFSLGSRLPLLGAMARPSGMLYSSLLQRPLVKCDAPFEVHIGELGFTASSGSFTPTQNEKERISTYVHELTKIHQRGSRLLMVNYPAARKKDREDWLMKFAIMELAKHVPFDYIDLESQIPREKIQFTDGVHLEPYSAAKILATTEGVIKSNSRDRQ